MLLLTSFTSCSAPDYGNISRIRTDPPNGANLLRYKYLFVFKKNIFYLCRSNFGAIVSYPEEFIQKRYGNYCLINYLFLISEVFVL